MGASRQRADRTQFLGKLGIIIAKTTQAIIVGHYGENAQPGNARSTVEALGDYLRKSGY